MSNVTNQLRLAEKAPTPGFLIFGRTLKPIVDYSQVIFRGNECIGCVYPYPQTGRQVKIHNGDMVVRIYSNYRMYTLTGTIATKDRYKRIYEIPLELIVNDPIAVGQAYLEAKDPAKDVIYSIKYTFEKYASELEHNKIPNMLPLAGWTIARLNETGILVEQKEKATFREDPYYTRQETLNIEANLQDLQDQLKRIREIAQKEYERRELAVQKVYERQELSKQREAEREEKTKDQIYDICYNLRQAAAEEITAALKERIHENFERGGTPIEISDQYFALISIFDDKTHIALDKSIIAGMYVDSRLVNEENDDEDEENEVK
jgi:hypothetical protein